MNTFQSVSDTNELSQCCSTFDKAVDAGFDPKTILTLILQYGPAVLRVLEMLLNKTQNDPKVSTISTTPHVVPHKK